jgi:hypothetical protein
LESALEGEITDHVGYEKHNPAGKNNGNSRNGTRAKTVLTGRLSRPTICWSPPSSPSPDLPRRGPSSSQCVVAKGVPAARLGQ